MKPVIKYGLRSIVREIVLAHMIDCRKRAEFTYNVIEGQAAAFGSVMNQQGRQSIINKLRKALSEYVLATQMRINELNGGRKAMGDKQLLAAKVFRALLRSGLIKG